MQKQKNKQRGITLIALVVSIIVLIILAGVSIAMLVGENGIITQAQRTDELTAQAQQKEAIELAVASVQAQGTLELDRTKLETALQSQLGDTSYTLTENGDGSFSLQIAERSYYIDSTGKIITEENMIAISSAEELKAFRDDVNSGNRHEGKYIYLTSDITLDINEEWEPIGIYWDSNTSITDETNIPFCGIFDGKNHIIEGMKITSKEKGKGLFGLVKNATIKNLGIGENCDLDLGIVSGAIAGYSYSQTIIKNCYNKTIINSNAEQVGGLVGQNGSECYIINCYNIGSINARSGTGGMAGYNMGVIDKSYNKGEVHSEETNVGGITGINMGTISNCYNTNTIEGRLNNVGGIAGLNINGKIFNTYNIGNLIGNSAGGIAGTMQAGNLENNYFLENTVNGSNGNVLEGSETKTSEELKKLVSQLGNVFKEDTNNINNGYPVLVWE